MLTGNLHYSLDQKDISPYTFSWNMMVFSVLDLSFPVQGGSGQGQVVRGKREDGFSPVATCEYPVALILCSGQLSSEVTKDSKGAVAGSQLETLRLCPWAL